MAAFTFRNTSFTEAKLIDIPHASDPRGSFHKAFEKDIFAKAGISFAVQEAFESFSHQNTLRGLHFQTEQPQVKLVRASTGTIYDVIVDMRRTSPTFGQWEAFTLCAHTPQTLLVPAGFAHGFYVLSSSALVSYLCAFAYAKDADTGIRYDDPSLAISWPVPKGETPVLSPRDAAFGSFLSFASQG